MLPLIPKTNTLPTKFILKTLAKNKFKTFIRYNRSYVEIRRSRYTSANKTRQKNISISKTFRL